MFADFDLESCGGFKTTTEILALPE